MQKKTVALLFIILIVLPFFSCRQWKVSRLTPSSLGIIPEGSGEGKIGVKTESGLLSELTFQLGVFGDRVVVSDNVHKRIQVLARGLKPELVVGSLADINTDMVAAKHFKFSVIGTFTMDSKGRLFVQNRFSGGLTGEGDLNFSPSYVLVFDRDGRLLYVLGQNGAGGIPFYYIESLFVDEKGRLFVVSRSYDTWTLFRFRDKKKEMSSNLSRIDFNEKDGDRENTGKIEDIRIYSSGDRILISVSYYHELRLKYRKLFDYSLESGNIIRTVVRMVDPKNVLFNLVEGKHIYFWDSSGEDLRFSISGMDGGIISNVSIDFDSSKSIYSQVYGTPSGEIYSWHADKNGIEILEWE